MRVYKSMVKILGLECIFLFRIESFGVFPSTFVWSESGVNDELMVKGLIAIGLLAVLLIHQAYTSVQVPKPLAGLEWSCWLAHRTARWPAPSLWACKSWI